MSWGVTRRRGPELEKTLDGRRGGGGRRKEGWEQRKEEKDKGSYQANRE